MRKLIYLLVILSFFSGCKKKESGKITYNISYTNSAKESKAENSYSKLKNTTGKSDSLYTQFGDYITSLSPGRFTAKFLGIRFNDESEIVNDGHILQLFDNNIPFDAAERYADFSNNSSVSGTPRLDGTVGSDGLFVDKEINFIYFIFKVIYFYQEVELPVQYDSIILSQFNQMYNNINYSSDSVISGNMLKVDYFPLIAPLTSVYTFPCPGEFVFGNTDSTYISTTESGNPIFGGNIGMPIIRSNKYSSFTLYNPEEGETLNIKTVMNFNYTDLIQVYAGADNIPFTSDDVFVYAPNFWERLSVQVTSD